MWNILNDAELSHAWENFRITAGLAKGEFKGTPWYDGDVYKWLEAAAYVYAVTKDKELDDLMDKVIDVIGKAQAKDGYISTFVQIGHGLKTYGEGGNSPYTRYEHVSRWQSLTHHELYNMGHLMTAACIHYRATGKTNFLKIAKKTGNYLYQVFRPERRPKQLVYFGFNPSNIMGALELYRTTGDSTYLKLAQIFVDMRGSVPANSDEYRTPLDQKLHRGGTDQNQTRTPLRKEHEAVGHAVTANYLYAGAADVYAETGDKTLLDALEKIWGNVVYQKMYITGGTSAYHQGLSSNGDKVGEAFGRNYELPNLTAYNESCANIAFGMWNWRMLSITGDARFADILETVLYNSAISGISLDGKLFHYTNPLRWYGMDSPHMHNDTYERLPYLGCFCCPPNVVRTIVKSGGWAYSVSDEGLWVNLYGANELNTELLDGTIIKLAQATNYPWDDKIKISVILPGLKKYAIMLRIPEWAKGASVKVNNQIESENLTPGQYTKIKRTWKKGDIIELNLPMKARLMRSNPKVEETRNQVAVMRGPIVYCLESQDLPPEHNVSEIIIPLDIDLEPHFNKELFGGVIVLEGEAYRIKDGDWSNKLYEEGDISQKYKQKIRLIPYYLWNNRGIGDMTVWMPIDL